MGTQIQGGARTARGGAFMGNVTARSNGHCNVQRLLCYVLSHGPLESREAAEHNEATDGRTV